MICPWCGPGPDGQHTERCWFVQRKVGRDPWGQPYPANSIKGAK